MKQQIAKSILVERLGHYLNTTCTEADISTLVYGWTRHNDDLRKAISHRKWLYDYEVQALSEYAGYNLLMDETTDFT